MANMEAYEVLYNRLKILLSEFLDADNEGDLITDLILKEPSERSLWIPVTKNGGKPLRTASVAEVEKLKWDATLEVKLGDSGLKTGISLEDHGNVTRLSEDLSRIIEMVLRTSEVTETKKEKS